MTDWSVALVLCCAGGHDYDAGVAYFRAKFLGLNHSRESKEIFVQATCATDTNNVRTVFNSCKEIILKKNLAGSGFMEY